MPVGEVQRIAGIVNILQNQHMAAPDVHGNVPFDLHTAGGCGSGVGRNPHKIHLAGRLDLPDHIRIEDDNALQNAHDHRVLPFVIFGQLHTQFLYPAADLLLRNENLQNIILHALFLHFSVWAQTGWFLPAGRLPDGSGPHRFHIHRGFHHRPPPPESGSGAARESFGQ